MRELESGSPGRGQAGAIVAAGLVSVAFASWMIVVGWRANAYPVVVMVVAYAPGLCFMAAGLIAWWRRPGNVVGKLAVAAGTVWYVGLLQHLGNPVLFVVGYLLAYLPPVVILHTVLAYPDGALKTRFERWGLAAVYLCTFVLHGLRYLDEGATRVIGMPEMNKNTPAPARSRSRAGNKLGAFGSRGLRRRHRWRGRQARKRAAGHAGTRGRCRRNHNGVQPGRSWDASRAGPAVRVIVAEDVGLYREMLVHTLTSNGIEVVGQAVSGEETLTLVAANLPDVVVLDIRMPPTFTDEGLRMAVRIRRQWPDIAVVLLSNYGEVEYAVELVNELTDKVGYLLKERVASTYELLEAIDKVAHGGVVIDPEVVTRLIKRPRAENPLRELTARELETLALMAEGHSNAAIARRMRIAVSTVEKYASAVFGKLAVGGDLDRPAGDDNARVRAVLTYLRHSGNHRSGG
jgi:DNA-binding NarL/FixJ family response regulator